MIEISVIIPTYKDWPRLKLCLEALAKQTYPADQFEVIVVNNDPEETYPYELPASNMKIITEAKPGSYAARNAGIKIGKGEILAFTDSDCIPDKDWLQNTMIQFKINPGLDRLAGAVRIFPLSENPSYINRYESIYAIRQDKYAAQGKAATANFFVKKKVFNHIGLFDDRAFSGEDHEWNTRAGNAGYTIAYGESGFVLHPARTKSQIITKTKRLLPRHIKHSSPSDSKLFLWFYGFYLIRPPFKYLKELIKKRKSYNLTTMEIICIFHFFFKIRLIRLKTHYSLLLGVSSERR